MENVTHNRNPNSPSREERDDPYNDINIEKFPPWLQENIRIFNDYDMRPYRPPRFTDGKYTTEIINELEDKLDLVIQFRVINPQTGNDWRLWINNEQITTIERYRDEGGFTVYNLSTEEFRQLVHRYSNG